MRGFPPFQALLLLITLAVLGFAGSRYIDMGSDLAPATPAAAVAVSPPESTCAETVDAEIELIFSSPPLSYKLTKPSAAREADQILLEVSSPEENPSYATVQVTSHELVTYWLDVVWQEDAPSGAFHFAQIHISPDHGDSQRFCFFSTIKSMNETFEYTTGEHHHE